MEIDGGNERAAGGKHAESAGSDERSGLAVDRVLLTNKRVVLESKFGFLQVERSNQVAALANALRAGIAAVLAVECGIVCSFERNILGNKPVYSFTRGFVPTAAADYVRHYFRANQLRFGEELPH